MAANSESCCNKCLLPIPDQASICSHCGSAQKTSTWNKVAGVLKWAGGIATVISLVAGALQLNALLSQIHAKNRRVETYLTAAESQFKSGDIVNAQLLLAEAEQLSPHSEQVRRMQVAFLLKEIRQYRVSRWSHDFVYKLHVNTDSAGELNYDFRYKADKEKQKEYFQLREAEKKLAIAVALSNRSRQAVIFAHLAWLDFLFGGSRTESEIYALLNKALSLAPHNVYTNLMMAAWVAAPDNERLDAAAKLKRLRKLFAQVKTNNDQELRWFVAMQYETLALLDLPQADMAMFQLALDASEPVYKAVAEFLLYSLNSYFIAWRESPSLQDKTRSELFQATFNQQQQLTLITRLGERARSCTEKQCFESQDGKLEMLYFQLLFQAAKQNGDHDLMMEAFRKLQINSTQAGKIIPDYYRHSAMSVAKKQPTELANFLMVRRNSYQENLLKGDVIVHVNDVEHLDKQGFKNAFTDFEKPMKVSFYRSGKLHETTLSKYHMDVFDYLLPARITDDWLTVEERSRLLAGWLID